ncbi:MAG: hypothetical protein ACLR8Y_04780 [Alistipes indistinctus]
MKRWAGSTVRVPSMYRYSFYDDRVIDTPRLTVPHPLMQQRGFVLRPSVKCCGFMHPVLHKSVRQLLDELSE